MDTQSQYSHTNQKGITYYLYHTDVSLRGGKQQRIYFFSKSQANEKGTACDLPEGKKVKENPRNGFLVLANA